MRKGLQECLCVVGDDDGMDMWWSGVVLLEYTIPELEAPRARVPRCCVVAVVCGWGIE